MDRAAFNRRTILGGLFSCAALPTALTLPSVLPPLLAAEPKTVRRAAIFGHTGRGNYGHRLDRLFLNRDDVKVVGVADPVAKGAAKVAALYPGAETFADYNQLLAKLKPELVVVGPRWTDQHHDMTAAALRAGAHVFLEKPFTQTLAEADALLSLAKEKNLRIAVAHQMLMDPNIQALGTVIADESLIGPLEEIRVFGKMDHRAGAEDLLVLGTHLFDMVRYFGGDAVWATAHIMEGDREVTQADARKARNDDLGLIAGTQIHAQLMLDSGVHVSFVSRKGLKDLTSGWGFELRGQRSAVRVFLNHPTRIYLRERKTVGSEITDHWKRWPADPKSYPAFAGGEAMDDFNRRLTDDWLAGIAENRDPICSGQRAMKSLEILHAILHAGLRRERVAIPLVDRSHPLSEAPLTGE